MRRLRVALCALCLALLMPLLLHASRVLPLDTRALVAEKYAGWCGVLRLWVCEGWPCGAGSVAPWLNRCAVRFEKAHPGVYVQPQFVDAASAAAVSDADALPPDMLLFPPGLLASPKGLAALERPGALRGALAACGSWNGATYAVPVALGGYAWAWNAALIEGIPGSWRGAEVSVAAPEPEAGRHWGAALLALCREQREEATGEKASPESLTGVDLGLGLSDEPAPSPTPVQETQGGRCRLPEGFAFDPDAWRRFIDGEAAAIPVSQREVRRLQARAEQGLGPDWRLSAGCAFTDQVLLFGLVDRPDAAPQRALCLEFLDGLLSDESQGALARVGAFGVTDAPPGCAANDPLLQFDAALRSPDLAVPNAFDGRWRQTADDIVRDFIADTADTAALWPKLATKLRQNPNDQLDNG